MNRKCCCQQNRHPPVFGAKDAAEFTPSLRGAGDHRPAGRGRIRGVSRPVTGGVAGGEPFPGASGTRECGSQRASSSCAGRNFGRLAKAASNLACLRSALGRTGRAGQQQCGRRSSASRAWPLRIAGLAAAVYGLTLVTGAALGGADPWSQFPPGRRCSGPSSSPLSVAWPSSMRPCRGRRERAAR
jgi:hypothetical protein